MAKKLTKKEMFSRIMTHLTDVEEINFIAHEIELLENKASGTRKPTANQKENEIFKETILEVLATSGKPMAIAEMQKANTELNGLTNQRISAMLKQLVDSGLVVKTYEKRKAYFSVAE